MKRQILFGGLICSAAMLVAQPAPPAALVALPVSTVTGNISQFNYGPNGEIESLVVAPNTLVNLPPDWAIQLQMLAITGNQAKVTGSLMSSASGMQILQPQSLEVAGKTLTMAVLSQPVPYAGSGAIRSLNYGTQGEINGFVLDSGVIARTPPIGASDVSVVKPGANISVSGFARTTASGTTVVDVQSITANGQTIAMNGASPTPATSATGPGRGRRGGPNRTRDLTPAPPPDAFGPPPPPPPDGFGPPPPPPDGFGPPPPPDR